MMLQQYLKFIIEHIPYGIGRRLACVPFSLRLGRVYGCMRMECATIEHAGNVVKERYAIEHFRNVFEYACANFPCYRNLYAHAGVLDLHIESFEDIRKIPVIDKRWTRKHIDEFKGAYRLNTGGSSGQPTPFWMDKRCWAREWAHMHTIWESIGYDWHDLKLSIRGKNLGRKPFSYNPVHNEFIINTYLKVSSYGNALSVLFRKRKIKWFHGYPSSIYQFIIEVEETFGKNGAKKLFKDVKGLLLSSEYPHPNQIEKFKEYGLRFVSWYGHSEMAILANGGESLCYRPFVTYGMTEVLNGHLVGTSYHNFDMPLIRYDTGDEVKEIEQTPGGLCEAFEVSVGRQGDYLEDKGGKKIPITAFVFGRHHHAFDVVDYVQLRQTVAGKCTLFVVNDKSHCEDLYSLFDLKGVDIDFDVRTLNAPIRTAAGKLMLRV